MVNIAGIECQGRLVKRLNQARRRHLRGVYWMDSPLRTATDTVWPDNGDGQRFDT